MSKQPVAHGLKGQATPGCDASFLALEEQHVVHVLQPGLEILTMRQKELLHLDVNNMAAYGAMGAADQSNALCNNKKISPESTFFWVRCSKSQMGSYFGGSIF